MIKKPEIVYESATRAEIERTKIDFRKKSSDELKAIAERVCPAGFLEDYGFTDREEIYKIASAELLQEREKKREELYIGYAREQVENDKINLKDKSPEELKAIVERVYPADFLEHYDLANRVALEKIAAAEMLQELGLGTALNEEVCRSVYINAARDEIEKAKMLMEEIKDKKIKTLASPKKILGFLPSHRLTYKNALNKIAAEEMISARKNAEKMVVQ